MTKPLTILIDIVAAGGIVLSFTKKVKAVAIVFAVQTLPVVQWGSAALGSAWFIYQFYQAFKKKK